MDVFRRWSTILLEIIAADADLVNIVRFRAIREMVQERGGIGRVLILWISVPTRRIQQRSSQSNVLAISSN